MEDLVIRSVGGLLQTVPDGGPSVDVGTGLLGSAVGSFLTTLVVGGILIALAPAFTERTMDAVRAEPLSSFGYGILVFVALAVVMIVLAITVVGLLVAFPLLLLTSLLWAIGAAVAFLAIGECLVGRDEGRLRPLVVGALLNGALALTGIGGLVGLCVGAAGFGAVLKDLLGGSGGGRADARDSDAL